MDSTARRITAGFLAIFFAVAGVVFPVSAHAATYNAASNLTGRAWYVPAQGTGIAGAPVVAAAATMLGRANPWIAAISLGTPVMQWLLEQKTGGNIQIMAKDAPFPTPPGWTTDALGPKPPLVVEEGWSWSWYPCTAGVNCTDSQTYPTCLSAVTAGAAFQGVPLEGHSCPNAGSFMAGGRWYGSVSQSCPVGYSATGNGCALSNRDSVKWPSDGVPTFVPNNAGTGFEQHPRDPDPLPSTPTPSQIQNPGRDFAPDAHGNPTSISFAPTPGGGFNIDQRVQTTNNNQTTTTINNVTINNLGTVTNISSTTVPGPIELASPGSSPVSGSPNIQFPTDYNRESTQQQAVQKLDDLKTGAGAADAPDYHVDQKKMDLNQEIKDKVDAIPGEYVGDKGNWFSWVWTPPVGACSPWVSTIHGQTVTWNVCPYIDKIRDVIGYLLAIGTTWAVYLQLFRRED